MKVFASAGKKISLTQPRVKKNLVSQVTSALYSVMQACMASSNVTVEGCAFANPDISGLNPQPDKLTRSLTSPVNMYAIDFDQHTFTTDYISTTCAYSFTENGTQVNRTIQLKDYVQGSWTVDSQIKVRLTTHK